MSIRSLLLIYSYPDLTQIFYSSTIYDKFIILLNW